ncbi:MAG TPA: hypothetical protein VNX18_20755 [Bryobacteraceae bacterium]|jgi:hypothetical protein|nr:hypothetical protein [Bryobacteraceae bacterium]
MGAVLGLVFLAVSVKQDGTHLRAGCAAEEESLATLASGAQITIRYALSGESVPCYKVTVQSSGKSMEGYLSSSEIEGLDDFEQERRDAARLDINQVMSAIRASTPMPATAPEGMKGIAGEAAQFIQSGQPARALEMLQAELRRRKDPVLLALAGVAAWKADDTRHALEYWRGSLDLKPNPELEVLVRRVEREAKSDQSADKLVGTRVVLRYDSAAVKTDAAREMLGALDEDYSRISQQLGCVVDEKIVAIVQSQDAYRKTTNAAEWSGGQFDGRIRVPVIAGQAMNAEMRRVFAHETVHACLSMLGRWPAWLQEGLAQKLSGDRLRPAVSQEIAQMAREHKLPKLENIGQDWSRLDSDHALIAYGLSLAAVEALYDNFHADGVGNLLRSPERLAGITAELDKRLGL